MEISFHIDVEALLNKAPVKRPHDIAKALERLTGRGTSYTAMRAWVQRESIPLRRLLALQFLLERAGKRVRLNDYLWVRVGDHDYRADDLPASVERHVAKVLKNELLAKGDE